jgi:hypothetical protein
MRQIAIRERAHSVPASHPTAESAVSPRGACRRFQLASRGRWYAVLSHAVGATRSGHNTARTHAYTPSARNSATPGPSLPGMVLKNSGLSCSRNASGIPSIQAAPPVLAHVQTIAPAHRNLNRNTARRRRENNYPHTFNGRPDTARRPRRALSQTQPARTRGEAQPQVRGTVQYRNPVRLRAHMPHSSVATEWHVRRGNVPMAVRKWRFIPIPKSPLHQGDRVRLQQLVCGSHCPWYQSWRKCRESAHCRVCFLARASGSRMGPTCRVAPIPTWRQHR